MRLFIAEKPSAAKAIAEALGVTGKKEGYLECKDDRVSWCFGHMLALAEPDEYTANDCPKNPKTNKKQWREEDLPIIPSVWKMYPKEEAKKQLTIIQKLLKEASIIVNAGDADREGQLLVDEVLTYFNNEKPVLRFWVSAQDPISIQRGLNNLKSNKEYEGLSKSAMARARADWLIGMNLSRAFTLCAKRNGVNALLTVGRVQTPTLALVVQRDSAIESFKSIPYYTIKAVFQYENQAMIAHWKPKDESSGLDEENRLINDSIASEIVEKITAKEGIVTQYKKEAKKHGQPRAFSLSDITLIASNKWGYSALETLSICQSLYETHKLTSYPRTDCSFLPESQHQDAPVILEALAFVNPELIPLIDKADSSIQSPTFNDAKITAHHGIIPTMHKGNKSALSDKERAIYDLIVRAYIAQFYPVCEYFNTTIVINIENETFETRGNTITQKGWKAIYDESIDNAPENDDSASQDLPLIKEDSVLLCLKAHKQDAKTKPPARFTEGTLQRAMENIHQTIESAEHKKMLKEGDGIGTSATRASIISELIRREFIEAKGKQISSTALGKSLINSLPSVVKSPVLTAMYESMLSDIEKNTALLDVFIKQQESFVEEQVKIASQLKTTLSGVKKTIEISQLYVCKGCQKGLCRRKSEKGYWWSCSGYPLCKQSYQDNKGVPNYKVKKDVSI